jgi:DNA-binding FadR family transcriptional regulator
VRGGAPPPLALERLPAPDNLATGLIRRLAGEIRAGRLGPGERLPTEQEMMRQAGVSRTVVREAVAALRAEGLVITRQGLGAFVAEHPGEGLLRIAPDETSTLNEVIKVLELRVGIEVEAAGLAAERRQAADMAAIRAADRAFAAAVASGDPAVEPDLAFHRTILAATGNDYFVRTIEALGRISIPRQSVRFATTEPERRAYLDRVREEHARIMAAIDAGDARAARLAMRRHLGGSRDRYRRLAGGA